jgi:CO dehydrogenase maturation factor
MGKRIVVTGRGGTGKTTFAALAARFLPAPKLLVDADPDQSLGAMLGVDLRGSSVCTVSEALFELQRRKMPKELDAMPMAERVEYLLQMSCFYESPQFDLISLGVKWTRGCYCAPNEILSALVPRIARNYAFTILDSPAGVEHVNRRVLHEVDDVFAIVDPSAKSLRNTETLRSMAPLIGFSFTNLYVVANHRFGAAGVERLRSLEGAAFAGRIEADPAVEEHDWAGRSLMDLPEDSPACVSVRHILLGLGYPVGGNGAAQKAPEVEAGARPPGSDTA